MRTGCVCRHCRCPNFAQEGESRGLCLVCERVELWGKNSPAYRGCRCTCRCKLQVVVEDHHDHLHDQNSHHHGGHPHPHPHPYHPRTPHPPGNRLQHQRHVSAYTTTTTPTRMNNNNNNNNNMRKDSSPASATHLLCADCAEQHRSNPRRHRPHGTSPGNSPSSSPTPSTRRNHHRRVTSIGISISAFKGIGFTPSSKIKERKRPCLTPYARKQCNMIAG
ncbi:hypothetical protein UCREL1_2796 [Eutypa lata UCREL1]|uniref:Uncharacterized protein n=1 Tax=Eutypa lata (strain UCR-EL1) TaxID=1287681 RepID=M7T056_EUTLA|nr:hypothetical protein UCREL1_2796 [Eutypa lata UCREL1]